MFVLVLHVRETFLPPDFHHTSKDLRVDKTCKIKSHVLNPHKFTAVPLFNSVWWSCWQQSRVSTLATQIKYWERLC